MQHPILRGHRKPAMRQRGGEGGIGTGKKGGHPFALATGLALETHRKGPENGIGGADTATRRQQIALDDPLEAAIVSALIELAREVD